MACEWFVERGIGPLGAVRANTDPRGAVAGTCACTGRRGLLLHFCQGVCSLCSHWFMQPYNLLLWWQALTVQLAVHPVMLQHSSMQYPMQSPAVMLSP